MSFAHLRLHTEYSLVDGIVRIPELIQAVVAARMPAIALTDQSNLFGMVKFYREAIASGIKPIVGVDAWIRPDDERSDATRIAFLCQNLQGYRRLTQLVTRSYLEGQSRGLPMLQKNWLDEDTLQGLIVLSGGSEGEIGQALARGREGVAARIVERWRTLCGDRFYVEVQRTNHPREQFYNEAALDVASRFGVAAVATNNVRFLARTDFEAHEARVCIREGALLADARRTRHYTEEQYLKTPDEMRALFADAPELIDNAVEIAKRCSLEIKLGESKLPAYPVPSGQSVDSFLRSDAQRGLTARMPNAAPAYAARLAHELDVICNMGFAGYFLIVADFIRWARQHGVPVGPGRGSGAGSVVAWLLGITDLDPIEHDLLFERFLNPERVSMPDFDIDFCMEGRDSVIDYVAEKYGRERVSQIITYGTLAAKAVVRDVGRVLGHPYGYVDRIAKLIPFEIGMTLDKALGQEPELAKLYSSDGEIKELIDLARALEGLARNAGTHAGGVVIAPSMLTDFTPLYCEEGSATTVTQFDKDDVEAAGLVKFDFLGLRTLTIIDRAVRAIDVQRASEGAAPLLMHELPMDDEATYALLKSCRTTAVFQLESRGMKDLIRRLQPDRFGDIVALVALFRPGPLQSGMVDDFISRKHDRTGAVIDYLHPSLESILKPTYGVILYQEQVMQIAQVLAGYTLGGADLLRRAMGKKKPEEMAKQRDVFVAGALARGVAPARATLIFDLMEKFAGYGFNKSHSAAYALLSYQTAWLKAHYPAAYMAAALSADMDKTDKIVILIDECNAIQLEVLGPDVNGSQYGFAVEGPRSIRFGMGAIKGVGAAAVDALVSERQARGEYPSLSELCRRVDLQKVNRRALEAMIRAGCLDRLGANRASLMANLDRALAAGEQSSRAVSTGQVDFFGLSSALAERAQEEALAVAEWSEAERLAGERDTLGLFLSGHPIAAYERELRFLVSARLADVGGPKPLAADGARPWSAKQATVAGLVLDIRRRTNRVTLILDDGTGRLEVSLFDEIYQQYRDVIRKDAVLVLEGSLRYDEFIEDWRLQARTVMEIDRARERFASRLWIRWCGALDRPQALQEFEQLLRGALKGGCRVGVCIERESYCGRLELPDSLTIRPTRDLLERLTRLTGAGGWYLSYPARSELRGEGNASWQ